MKQLFMRAPLDMPRIYFLIRSLERGGAERQLIELARGLAAGGYEVTVATLYAGGALRHELEDHPNIRLRSFEKRSRWDCSFLLRLVRDARAVRPRVIHGYMSPANELAVLLAKLCRAKSLVGLRASNMELSRYDALARQLFRTGALASHLADAVVVNSHAGCAYHRAHGYAAERMVVIPNGVDCDRFKPNAVARQQLRTEWRVAEGELLFGLVGRIDPMKDHETYLRAIAQVSPESPARFVCVGGGSEQLESAMRRLASALGIERRVLWVGARDDMWRVYNALDVSVLCSAFGEGFPNAVGEAMATERACIVTDVGDSKRLVGDTGAVVPARDPRALAQAIQSFANAPEDELSARGRAARRRIVENFSTQQLVLATTKLFDELFAGGCRAVSDSDIASAAADHANSYSGAIAEER